MAKDNEPRKTSPSSRPGAAGGHATWLKYGPEHYRRITKGGVPRPTYEPEPDGQSEKKGVPEGRGVDRKTERERVRQLARFCSPHDELPPLMTCGHAAQAATYAGHPVCLLCLNGPRHGDALAPMAEPPNLAGRTAVCRCCEAEQPSDAGLPFFQFQPLFPFDSFYCKSCTTKELSQ